MGPAVRRLLVSAYGCEPGKGSEQGVGWNWVLVLARFSEVWVITRANNRTAIEREVPQDLAARIRFVYYDLPRAIARLKRRDRGLYFYYALWQWGAYRRARQLARDVRFDYCQHLTFGSMWMPTFMHRLGIPFVWGPIGGGESVPTSLLRALPFRARLLQQIRKVAVRFARLNPWFSAPARSAIAIIARTEESRLVFSAAHQAKIRTVLETGITAEVLGSLAPANPGDAASPLELVYTGRLVAIKWVDAAVRALAIAARSGVDARLTIVGDGPLRHPLAALARSLGIQDRVVFAGVVSQAEVLRSLQRSHVFIFPSLKEGGTWSLIEAMAVGLPIVCLDTTGMHVVTDEACAIRIPPTSAAETVERMAAAIVKLARFPRLRRSMGEAGRRRTREHFSWDAKGVFMQELLAELDRAREPTLVAR